MNPEDRIPSMRAIARWCHRHRLVVLAAWLIALLAFGALQRAVGSDYADDFNLPQTQSAEASTLLHRSDPRRSGDTDQLVMAVDRGSVADPAARARMEALLAKIRRLPHVTSIGSPYAGARGAAQIAPSGDVAFATIGFDIPASQVSGREAAGYDHLIASASGHGIRFAGGGQVAEDGNPSASSAGLPIGFAAAGVVLLIVFGTVPAMMLPLLTAALSLGTGSAVVALLSNVIGMASFSSELAMLIGLGVGVDYALFIVTRYRQGLLRGLTREEAVVRALDTSGRAVLFAGAIVCIAMLGMFLLGVGFLYGVAIAAAITVAFTVLAALTLLPALLALFGGCVLRRRDRRAIEARRFTASDESPLWRRWTGVLARRPALFAALAAGLMILIAIPFLSMRLGSADSGSDPAGSTTRKAYDLLAKGFGPGYNGPLQLVAQVSGPAQEAAFARVERAVASTPGVVGSTRAEFIPSRAPALPGTALASVYPKGSPQDASTSNLLHTVRDRVVPAAERGTGLHVLVGGQTAIFDDFATVLSRKLPLFLTIVIGLSFLLLTCVFRSVVIPTVAAAMNLLSAAAAFGVVTAVFQDGIGSSLLGIDKTGPIEAFVPVFMFAILFRSAHSRANTLRAAARSRQQYAPYAPVMALQARRTPIAA